jgi:predicted dehydrogenase
MNRKEFLKTSLLGVAALAVAPSLTGCAGGKNKLVPLKKPGEYYLPEMPDKAPDGRPLKAGLVGCGGRGTGAATDFLNAANGVSITALGDIFPDKIQSCRAKLQTDFGVTVDDANCFVGFDAYKKVMDSGVDVVILATPPAFRPEQFKYAVEKGLHAFIEKPVSVDPDGYRSIVASLRLAESKRLSIATGTVYHHHRGYVEAYRQVMNGAIGEIRGGNVYYNRGDQWFRDKQPGWSDMEWMLRNWVNWIWLSGDAIIEQHVHSIDIFTWFSGLKPVGATGVGSRQRRATGNVYDNFSIDFDFGDGIHVHSMCRQIDGCSNNISEIIQGTRGVFYGSSGELRITDLAGNEIWKYDKEGIEAAFTQNNPYVLQHVDWISHIRGGEPVPVSQPEGTAISTLTGIMGREAAYTGKTITWNEVSAMSLGLVPEELTPADFDMSKYKVPVPGSGK